MPFTPYHMGPGILLKAVLQGSFSLLIFGWTQVVMDLQPLLVLLTGKGQLHGFTHTLVGATLIALFCAVTGKYLSQFALGLLPTDGHAATSIRWWAAVLSGFIGSYSHVVIDSIMHADVTPFAPYSTASPLLGSLSVSTLHRLCLYSGLLGTALFIAVNYLLVRWHGAAGDRRSVRR